MYQLKEQESEYIDKQPELKKCKAIVSSE